MELHQFRLGFHRCHIYHFQMICLMLRGLRPKSWYIHIQDSKYQSMVKIRLLSKNFSHRCKLCSLLQSSSKVYNTDHHNHNYSIQNRPWISHKVHSHLDIPQNCHSTHRCSLFCYSCGFSTYCSAHKLKWSLDQKHSHNICQQCISSSW